MTFAVFIITIVFFRATMDTLLEEDGTILPIADCSSRGLLEEHEEEQM